jgi:hypothetical protein
VLARAHLHLLESGVVCAGLLWLIGDELAVPLLGLPGGL